MLDQKGIRKAAVFLNGLDWETAGLLLKKLPAEEAKAIRREMVAAEGISTGEINKTVKQFLQETQYGRPDGGKNTNGQVKTVFSEDGVDLFELSGDRRENVVPATLNLHTAFHEGGNVPESNGQINGKSDDMRHDGATLRQTPEVTEEPVEPRRFDYLERMSPFDAASFLAEEGEQLIAVVLSQLTPRYSGDVLACFEQSLKRSLIRRLAKLDATDEMIMDEIDMVLKDRLKREVEELPKTKPGLALLERILQVVDSEIGSEIGNDIISSLNEIDMEEQQAAYYEQYGGYDSTAIDGQWPEDDGVCHWSFDDLALLEDHELEILFRMQDHDLVAKSLLACDEFFVGRVLGRFPVYEQATLRKKLRDAARCDPEEQAYARQCVMQGAAQLVEDGRIADIPLCPGPTYVDSRSAFVDYSV